MAARTLYLVRHGQYQRREIDELEDGLTWQQRAIQVDGGLTPLGIEQAQLTAKRLSLLPIGAIYASSLPRAAETADIIAQAFPRVPCSKSRVLWECIPSVPLEFAQYLQDAPPEMIAHGKKQAQDAFDRYFKGARGHDKHELLVCHGNLIRYLVCRVLRVRTDAWPYMGTNNCGLSKVVITRRFGPRLVSFNEVGHLSDHLTTES